MIRLAVAALLLVAVAWRVWRQGRCWQSPETWLVATFYYRMWWRREVLPR